MGALPYRTRLVLLIALDSVLVLSAILIGFLLIETNFDIFEKQGFIFSSLTLVISYHFFAFIYHLYNKSWDYASIRELAAIIRTATWSIAFTGVVYYLFTNLFHLSTVIVTWMLLVLFVGGSRFGWRMFRSHYLANKSDMKNTLIIGAGAAGRMIARQLQNNAESELRPVAFIDDDPNKNRLEVLGVPIVGNSQSIVEAVEKYGIENIVIAIPSLTKKELKSIYAECAKTNIKTQILPKIEDIMLGKVSVSQFQDVSVQDLLGREPVELDNRPIAEYITGRTIMVTGAGGSIGSEICRQVCKYSPKQLILVGHGENSIYLIDMELRKTIDPAIEIIPIIADVQDRVRIFDVMAQYVPDVVYHAAAHKHVPLMEYNPHEAVKNNIFGTKNVAEASDQFGVKNFVMISTDKAVNPPNVMGATKRFAEMIVQNLDKESNTKFVAVRFGNVLGSRGSVIPLFKKQIAAGGPVTVTDPAMTRYFMMIPEASALVLQAGALAHGGEVFVLDMGEPVKIVDLAKNLIKLSGFTEEEIGIEFTGMRPGEKLFEELLNDNEVQEEHVFPKIHIGKASPMEKQELYKLIDSLETMNTAELKETLISIANTKFSTEKELIRNAN